MIRAYIKNVSHDCWSQTSSVEVWASRVYWQRSGVFEHQLDPSGSPSWHGRIHTMLRCHVKPGDGEFLFTGSEHFGEAWLGCAPRYKNFLSVYEKARLERRNSCDFPLGWDAPVSAEESTVGTLLCCHSSEVASGVTSRGEATETLVKNTEQEQTVGPPEPRARLCLSPIDAHHPGRPRRGWVSFCGAPHFNCCSLGRFCVTVALWTAARRKKEPPPFTKNSWIVHIKVYFYSNKCLKPLNLPLSVYFIIHKL